MKIDSCLERVYEEKIGLSCATSFVGYQRLFRRGRQLSATLLHIRSRPQRTCLCGYSEPRLTPGWLAGLAEWHLDLNSDKIPVSSMLFSAPLQGSWNDQRGGRTCTVSVPKSFSGIDSTVTAEEKTWTRFLSEESPRRFCQHRRPGKMMRSTHEPTGTPDLPPPQPSVRKAGGGKAQTRSFPFQKTTGDLFRRINFLLNPYRRSNEWQRL
mmetsp:Transcript_18676/g.39269  ORF Transcript_18676/g.39269 Transcript_18676/m.39269 type:complete len:210 (-) Transcript_18676:1103-1732(-)